VIDLNSGGLTIRVLLIAVPLAEMLTDVTEPTGIVLIVNVPEIAPPATVHDVTVAAGLLLTSWIVMPVIGAGAFRVSVPLDWLPPMTDAGLSSILVMDGGLIVSLADAVEPLVVILTDVNLETGVVLTVNVPVVEPAGTIAAVAVAEVLLQIIGIVIRSTGAALRVIVPCAELPPSRFAGSTVIFIADGGLIVSVAAALDPLAVILTGVTVETDVVLTVNVPVVAPSSTVVLVGVAAGALEAMEMVRPPAGAGALSVTVPVDGLPPRTLVGLSVMLAMGGADVVTVKLAELVAVPIGVTTAILPVVAPAGTVAVMN